MEDSIRTVHQLSLQEWFKIQNYFLPSGQLSQSCTTTKRTETEFILLLVLLDVFERKKMRPMLRWAHHILVVLWASTVSPVFLKEPGEARSTDSPKGGDEAERPKRTRGTGPLLFRQNVLSLCEYSSGCFHLEQVSFGYRNYSFDRPFCNWTACTINSVAIFTVGEKHTRKIFLAIETRISTDHTAIAPSVP